VSARGPWPLSWREFLGALGVDDQAARGEAPGAVGGAAYDSRRVKEGDAFFALGFDGELKSEPRYSVVAGSLEAENRMIDLLHANVDAAQDLSSALKLALEAWATGKIHARRTGFGRLTSGEQEEEVEILTVAQVLREEIAEGTVEAGLLDRKTARESKFRLLLPDELRPALEEYR